MEKRLRKNTDSNAKGATTLAELNKIFGRNKELIATFDRIDLATLRHCSEVMRTTWPEMLRAERQQKTADYASLKGIYFAAGICGAKHIDQSGVTKALAPLMHNLSGFSYVDNADNLAFEHFLLVDTMGIDARKVAHLWSFVEARKAATIRKMSRPGFRLEACVKSARSLCDKPGGEPWEHSSPVAWRKIFMAVCAVSNVAGAVASGGSAAGIAGVSVLLAVAGMAAS
jgi:hypothetical protein